MRCYGARLDAAPMNKIIRRLPLMICSVSFFFSSRRRHTRCLSDWSSDVCSSDLKMGTDATAAAGPGATAASASDAEILTYGKAEGLFAGVSLGGATVEPDNDANHRLYGKTLTPTKIVRENGVQPTTESKSFVAVLDSKIAKHSN